MGKSFSVCPRKEERGMLKSMTGFGRCEEVNQGFTVQIQIKSVNHRYSDFTVKTPRHYMFLEEPIRALAAASIARGKVEILVSLDKKESDNKTVTLDKPMAEGYLNALRGLGEYGIADDLTMSALVRVPDIFHVEYEDIDEDALLEIVSSTFKKALDEFIEMRISEGARLEESLRSHLDNLLGEVAFVEAHSPETVKAYEARLYAKINEILEDKNVDEGRLLTEVAVFADKVAVDEEVVRLRSHIKAFEGALSSDAPIGKKLDFIVQEMNRETNTIGSKCNDFDIAQHVVEMKSIIEKIREQIQNIE